MKRSVPRRRRGLAGGVLAAATALVLSACGLGSEDEGLVIGQFSWTHAELQVEILKAIVEDHPDLGIETITTQDLDPAAAWTGLGRGDLDLLVEVNLPNQQAFADENAATTELVSNTYDGAAQGWFVPSYLVAPGGEAEGLTSVDQLADPEWAEKVGGTLFDADAGWVTSDQNAKRLEAFGIDLEHSNSAEAALLSQVERSYSREEPILFYFYRPHWVFNSYDLVQIEEPHPYEEGCFEEGGRDDCAIPELAAWIAINSDLRDESPEFVAFLEQFQIPLEDIEALLEQHESEGTSVPDLARQWVDDNADQIEEWVG